MEIATHLIEAAAEILGKAFVGSLHDFTASIVDASTGLREDAFSLGMEGDILFSSCAPPPSEINALFANANYPGILGVFQASGNEMNPFQHLTGEATYNGNAVFAP